MSGQAERFAAIDKRITAVERRRVTHKWVEVVATNTVASTFTAELPDGQQLDLSIAPAFLPSVGDLARVRLEGSTPIAEPVRIAAGSLTGDEIGSLPPDRLEDGNMPATITISGGFYTALSGQRTALTTAGLRAWNAGGNLTVDLNGVDNLLTGRFRTALSGRRIEMNVSGDAGQISFIAEDGNTGIVDSYTQTTGEEAMRVAMPLSASDWAGWNALSFQTNNRAYMATSVMQFYYGGGSGSQSFDVAQASTRGTTSAGPAATSRLRIDTTQSIVYGPDQSSRIEIATANIRMYAVHSSASIDIIEPNTGASSFSPRMLFRAQGGTNGGYWKYVIGSGGVSPHFEARNTADSGYIEIYASGFPVQSTQDGKTEIADWTGDGEAILDAFRPRVYRRQVMEAVGGVGPREIGFVAEELPADVLTEDGKAVNTYSVLTLVVAAFKRLRTRVNVQAVRIANLETAVKSLGGVL